MKGEDRRTDQLSKAIKWEGMRKFQAREQFLKPM